MIFKDIDIGIKTIKIPHLYNLEQSLNLLDYELGRVWFQDFRRGFNRIQSIICGNGTFDLLMLYDGFKMFNSPDWNTGPSPIRPSLKLRSDHIVITLEKPSTNQASDSEVVEIELRIIEI